MPFHDLRRALAEGGAQVATTRPAGSQGRSEEARIRPARLVEHDRLTACPVGLPAACPEPIAFLDGIQRHQVIGYAGAHPIIGAVVAAAVRARGPGGHLHTVAMRCRRLLVGRAAALAGVAPGAHDPVVLPDEEPAHPIRDIDMARAVVDDARTAVEVETGLAFRAERDDWLVVDGSLAESPAFASDARMLGISKSHATLPFEGPDLVRYLQLPAGHRSSVFQPASHRGAQVYAWGLRLWPWEGRDLLFGLVRIEAAPSPASLAAADAWSRWLLAERVPVSSPDARWDRLLYGIHSVEEYLRAAVLEP